MFRIWREQTSIFSKVAAYDFGGAGLNLTGGDHPLQVQGVHVSADYFSMMGAPVATGRTFTQAEDSPHGGRVAVLSYGLWKSRFGGNADCGHDDSAEPAAVPRRWRDREEF